MDAAYGLTEQTGSLQSMERTHAEERNKPEPNSVVVAVFKIVFFKDATPAVAADRRGNLALLTYPWVC